MTFFGVFRSSKLLFLFKRKKNYLYIHLNNKSFRLNTIYKLNNNRVIVKITHSLLFPTFSYIDQEGIV